MKVIGITGYKQSGKDTVGKLIQELCYPLPIIRISFADALKDEVSVATGVTREYLEAHKSAFRLILQGWGTDFRRNLCGDTYWLHRWLLAVNRLQPIPFAVIATDVRFPNEADVIRQLNGTIIRVENVRVVCDGHASEREVDTIPADVVLMNNGTLDELKQQVKTRIKLTT